MDVQTNLRSSLAQTSTRFATLLFLLAIMMLASVSVGYSQNGFCLDFEELVAGTTWGNSSGQMPGEVVFTEEGVPVSLTEFHYLNGTTGFNNAFVETVSNPPFSLGNGLGLFPSNVGLSFDLSGTSEPVIGLEFTYYNYGGELNLQVNNGTVHVIEDFIDLPTDLGGGITATVIPLPTAGEPQGVVTLTGPVEQLMIGGQELHFDNLCVLLEESNPICSIGDLHVEPLSCNGQNEFNVLLDFSYEDVGTAGFEVTGNGMNYGTYLYSDLPVEVGPFTGDGLSTLELVVSDLEFVNCVNETTFPAVDCSDLCLGFEELESGTSYGSSTGYGAGDTIFNLADIPVVIHEFETTSGATVFGSALATDNVFYSQYEPIEDLHLIPSNVNLDFDFSNLPYLVVGARLGYAYGGGDVNLSVNGESVEVASSPGELPILLGSGVLLEVVPDPLHPDEAGYFVLTGALESLQVGGQELAIDNLCLFYEGFVPICGIGAPEATAQPCNAEEEFFVTLDFPYENVGNLGFTVQGNGINYGTFSYADLPISLGPLEGDGTTFYEFVVTDNEFPNCSNFIEFGKVSCNDLCVQFEGLPVDTSYGVSNGNLPGDVIFSEDGVIVSLAEFVYFGGSTGFNNAVVNNTTFSSSNLMVDNRVFQGNINLVYDFTNQPGPVTAVSFAFVDGGGEENFGVNGHDILVLNDFGELPLQILPAGIEVTVTEDPNSPFYAGYVTVTGPIETLTVGGQESAFDNFCFTYEDPACEIFDLVTEVGDCHPDGSFDLWVDFEVSNPTDDSFDLYYNGEFIGFYALADLPLQLEGLTGTAGEIGWIKVCINDNADCCHTVEFEIPNCGGGCEIWDLLVEAYECDADGNFLVDLTFNYNNVGNDGFEVYINGENEGTFAYGDLPITLGPLAGDGSTIYEFWVKDVNHPDCSAIFELGPINCEEGCEIFDLVTEVGDCHPDGSFDLWVDFDVANPTDDSFDLYYNGEFVGFYALADLPLQLEGLTGTAGEIGWIKVCINDNPDCCHTVEFEIPNCGGGCEIWELFVEAYECDAEGNFLVDLTFNYDNVGNDGFEVYINGVNEGTFAYGDLPITLGPLAGDGSTVYEFWVKDVNHPDCGAIFELGPINCEEGCEIFELVTEVGDCHPDGSFDVWVDFEVTDPGNDFFEVYYDAEYIGFYPLSDLPLWVEGLEGVAGDEALLKVCINDVPNCCATTSFVVPDCDADGPCIEFEEPAYGTEYSTSTGYFTGDTMLVENDVVITLDSMFLTSGQFTYGVVWIEDVFGGNFTLANGQYPFISNSSLNFDFSNLPGEVVSLSFDYYFGGGDVMISINNGPLTATIHPEDWETLVFPDVDLEVIPSASNPNMGTVIMTGLIQQLRIGGQEWGMDNLCFEIEGGTCAIGELAVELLPCENGLFYVLLDFPYENVGDDGFVVYGNGENYGTFEYDQLPVEIGPFVGDGTSIYELIVEDVQDESCGNFTEFGPKDCGGDCVVEALAIDAVECQPDGTFKALIDFEYLNPGNDFFEVYYNGEYIDFYPLDELPVWVVGLTGEAGEIALLKVCINDQPDCCATIEFEVPDCDSDGDVWPGDANLDNIAQNFDVLNLGIAFNSDGPARTTASIDWEPMPADAWADFFEENDVNYKHADCNGDGVVDLGDLEAIDLNYDLTHGPVDPFVPLLGDEEDPPFFVDLPAPGTVTIGEPFEAHIVLGSSDVPVEDIYGIAFTIVFDPDVIDPASVEISYPASWMGAPGVNLITFDKKFLEDGIIDVTIVRNDQNNVNGFGKVVDFIGIIDDVLGKAEVEIHLEDVKAIMVNEVQIPLFYPVETITISSTSDPQGTASSMVVFPNPTSDKIFIRSSDNNLPQTVRVIDARGGTVLTRQGTIDEVNLTSLPPGMYTVLLRVEEQWMVEKVIKN